MSLIESKLRRNKPTSELNVESLEELHSIFEIGLWKLDKVSFDFIFSNCNTIFDQNQDRRKLCNRITVQIK